jgi:GxxExxY protein
LGPLLRFTTTSVTVFCIVYQRSLEVELVRLGFNGDLEKRTTVRYKDVIVGDYDGDMIVNDVVLAEIKIAPQ